jgi:hypothetical protein
VEQEKAIAALNVCRGSAAVTGPPVD